MIDGTPQVDHLATQLHVHLIKVPSPLTKAAHAAHTLVPDVGGKERAEPVPPAPHRLMADVDPRSNSRSSTFRSDKGKRTYIITTNRITSGDELK